MLFVLIPGSGGDAWYWHLVEPELRARGHDVVSVQLPAADERAGLAEYAQTVVDAIGDRQDVALVAQSMAGFTAPLVCSRVPVQILVFLNAMIPRPGETPGEWWANTSQEEARRAKDARERRDPDAPFDLQTYFLHDLPPDVVEALMARPEPRQADRPFSTPCTFETWPDVPTHVLTARDDRFFPAEFQRRVARDRLGITPDEVPGGHLVALSHPKELAQQLAAYVGESQIRELSRPGQAQ
ncbi:MAG TPA: alpha/beta hydrolase [Chloroflexota bacterium]|jgi:pimeloyl-ACP methyl ester carboxylesterase